MMRPEEIETLNRARTALCDCLIPTESPFIDYLLANGVLSMTDVEKIQKISTTRPNAEAVHELLKIYTRKAKSLEPLVQALRITAYSNLVHALTQPASADNAPVSPTMTRRIIRAALSSGGVPRRPDFFVERQHLLDEVRKALLDVSSSDDNGWVILHGMPGIGKSVLAAAVLSDPAVTGTTFSSICWLNIGPHGDEKLLRVVSDLFSMVDKAERQERFDDLHRAKLKLKDVFLHDAPKTLVVLDDVWTESVIRAFDNIGCHILATVREIDVFNVVHGKKEFIRIPDSGFSLEETLDAFAKWLKVNARDLPPEAEKIYRQCQGHPFEISLIGSLLKDHKDRWSYYYEMLRLRKVAEIQKRSPYPFDNFAAAVELSLANLPDDLRMLFKSLGVFQRGSDISLKALMLYWDKTQTAVEDIMLALSNRSLVEKLPGYSTTAKEIYRIHVLLHETLKGLNGPEEQMNLHKTLLQSYLAKSGGCWDQLPRDGYIHEYVAYHLFRSGDEAAPWDIFLNLSFITEKLLQCGPVQTLTNYKRYEEFIRKWGDGAFEEFQAFIRRNLHFLNDKNKMEAAGAFDEILSLAMQEPMASAVHRQARLLNEQLHFAAPKISQNGAHAESNGPAVSDRYEMAAINQALWLPDGNGCAFALISASGTLRICSSATSRKLFKIKMEHVADCFSISPNSKRALVCCTAGLFMYDLPEIGTLLSLDDYSVSSTTITSPDFFRTPSPLLNMWPASQSDSNSIGGRLDGTGAGCRYRSCQISHDCSKAITGDADGALLIWNLNNDQRPLDALSGHTGSVNSCEFSNDDEWIVSCGDDGLVMVWRTTGPRQHSSFVGHEKRRVSSCCWIDGGRFANHILTNSYTDFAIWNRNGEKRMEWKAEVKAVCSDVSKCGRYVAAGLRDGSIAVWQLKKEAGVLASVFKSHTDSPATSVNFHSDSTRLLVSRQDGIIEIWNVERNHNET